MAQRKPFYSTTEVADICNVHRNTIILAIKKGHLRASSTPGGHNRVAHKDLVKFIRERDLPVIAIPGDGDEPQARRIKMLVVVNTLEAFREVEQKLAGGDYELRWASNGYGAGLETARFNPDLILIDLADLNGAHVLDALGGSDDTRGIRVIASTSSELAPALRVRLGDEVPLLAHPYEAGDLTRAINTVLTTQLSEVE